MAKEKTFADDVIISAAALKYKPDIHMYCSPERLESRPIVYSCKAAQTELCEPISMAFVSVNFGYTNTWKSDKIKDHFISLVKK